MTIDEAIRHCKEVAERYERMEDSHDEKLKKECLQCAADHRQLAEWLRELKELRNSVGAVKLAQMKDALNLISDLRQHLFSSEKDLKEAKRLLQLAVEDFKSDTESICSLCKNNDIVDGCPHIDDSQCEFIWRYADEAEKLLGKEI